MGSQQRTQTHPGISHDVPHTRTRGISPLKDVSRSKCTVAQYLHLRRTAFCWVSLCIKWEVCIKVEFIVMLIDKVFSWTALGLESVHSLEARCSHVVIIIPWLFGKTGLASGTFIYRHGKTRKYVCWHSKWKQNKQTKCLQLEENQEKKCSWVFLRRWWTFSSEPLTTPRQMLDPFCALLQKHSRRGAKRLRNLKLL